MKLGINKSLLGLALALASTAAIASVTFDASNGTGFVGKGDVQTPFGWNDAALQANAKDVTFTYGSTTSYGYECTWYTTTGGPNPRTLVHNVDHTVGVVVSGSVAYEARTQKKADPKITGFILTGFGSTFATGFVPVVGGTNCPGNAGTGATITSVWVVNGGEVGGLWVHYFDSKALIY